MLFHKECGQPVNLNVASAYLIEGVSSVADGYMQVNSLQIEFRGKKTEKFKAVYNCCQCSEDVEAEDLICSCTRCYETKDTSELFKVQKYPGIYCQTCLDELTDALTEALDKLVVKPLMSSLATFKIT